MGKEKIPRSGFTRADLLVVVGCICFLAVACIRPLLANSAARNDDAVCANNLRHIGQAFAQWSQEHNENYAWWLDSFQGGTKGASFNSIAWFHFFVFSNELRSPRFLADPADDWGILRVPTSWGTEENGLVRLQNSGISYFVGLHATPLLPQSILSGDGNVYGLGGQSCASGLNNVTAVTPQNGFWPQSRHEGRGNLLFDDGRVEMTDTARLKEAVGWNNNWNLHYLTPHL